MTTPKRRRYIPRDVQEAIEERADGGYSPKQIEDELSQDADFADRLPTIRTIQNIVAERLREPDAWRIDAAPEVDPSAAFTVLSELIKLTSGRVAQLSHIEACWITTLRHLRSDLPSWHVYRLAREYILRRQRKESTADLDAFLAFAPWRESPTSRYMKAIEDRLLETPPLFLWALIPGVIPEVGSFAPVPLQKLTGADAAKFKLAIEEAQDDSQR